MIEACGGRLKEVPKVFADGEYTGEKFAGKAKEQLGAEVEIAKRNELHAFAVIPKRWVVERSSAGLRSAAAFGRTANASCTPPSKCSNSSLSGSFLIDVKQALTLQTELNIYTESRQRIQPTNQTSLLFLIAPREEKVFAQ
jgi:transposase